MGPGRSCCQGREPDKLVLDGVAPIGDGLASTGAAQAAEPVHEAAQLVVGQRAAPRAGLAHLRECAG